MHDNIRHQTLARRDGTERRVDVRELVPGDIVTLGIGNVVPADIRLLEATRFECDEAVLTGESMPAAKSAHAAPGDESDPVPSTCAFMGTIVHQGSARGVVVSTGSATAFGRIAVGLGSPPAYTAFQIGLNEFSRLLVWIAGILTVSIFVINVAMSRPVIDAVLFSLAIAIGITPQLLPAIVSVSLAAGSRGLARRKVLVKRLVTIEDLGNIRLLFTDKTGTLTEGIVTFAESLDVAGVASPEPLALGRVCNEATLTAGGPVGGNLLDQALCAAAGVDGSPAYERLGLLPFDHDRQLVSATARTPTGGFVLVTKGAPEAVLRRCVDVPAEATVDRGAPVRARAPGWWPSQHARWTTPALRVPRTSAICTWPGSSPSPTRPRPTPASRSPSSRRSTSPSRSSPATTAPSRPRCAATSGSSWGHVLTGAQIESLDDDELSDAIPATTVFARVSPDQKSRIIKVARRRGDDVAFLGDGVNDAVALHAADVGHLGRLRDGRRQGRCRHRAPRQEPGRARGRRH